MRSVWPKQKRAHKTKGKAKGGAVAEQEEEPLLRRERQVLRFLEAQGMEKDAQLCRERLAVMTA